MDDRPYPMKDDTFTTQHVPRSEPTSRILPLPPDAVAQIHSSKQITSLQGVVFALLENSLDSNANKIGVSFSSSRGACSVEDNGRGIPPSEFLADGGLGKVYHTSKAFSAQVHDLHGSTGTYLASLSALSLLSITSRHCDAQDPATLTLHQGRVLTRQVPSNDLINIGPHGTCVNVKDLFGNMPVRVKQRALASDMGIAGNEKIWHDLTHGITALLLAWRSPCSVKLRDTDMMERSLVLSGSHPTISGALTEKSLNQLLGKSARYDLRDALPVVFQAGLALSESRPHWVPISASTLKLSVRGSICLDPAPTKVCQFVSIGVQPCSASSGFSEIFESINRIFANSSFGSTEEVAPLDEAEKDRRKRDRRYKADGYTQKQIRGGKGIDRWPMFVLQIKLRDHTQPASVARNTSDHQLKDIIDVLEAMVEQWLAANNFRPRKRRKRRNEEQHSPAGALGMRSPDYTYSSGPQSALERPSSLRRVVTADGLLPPRGKRRIVDLSESKGSSDPLDTGPQHSPNVMPNNWTRIKSGRDRPIGSLQMKEKPLTAPSGAYGSAGVATVQKKGWFDVPTVEAGSLASRKTTDATWAKAANRSPAKAIPTTTSEDDLISSDYFDSVSDGELLAAERATKPVRSGQPSILDSAVDIDAPAQDHIVDWVNPITKQGYKVNSRTGVVLPPESRESYLPDDEKQSTRRSAAINTAVTSAGRPLTLSRRAKPAPNGSGSSVLPKEIREWQNPVFAPRKEEQIPIASISGPGTETSTLANHRCSHDVVSEHFAGSGDSCNIKLNKADLARAKVINQVDKKFILCGIPSPTGCQTLILIDQHAASERIILETLLTDLCAPINPTSLPAKFLTNTNQTSSITTTLLPKPAAFELSQQEHALFLTHTPHFARWGILYDLSATQDPPSRPRPRISIRALPPAIAERCTLFPALLIDLLRSEIWLLADTKPSAKLPSKPSQPDETPHWLRAIGSCPKALRDLLASRACRSAVMFNDVLSVGECEGLVGALARCVFPFVCAHGRVGIVPLAGVGEGEVLGGGLGWGGGGVVEDGGFLGAWDRWRSGRGGDVRMAEGDG